MNKDDKDENDLYLDRKMMIMKWKLVDNINKRKI